MPDYCPSDWAAWGDPRLDEEPPEETREGPADPSPINPETERPLPF